MPKIRTSSGDYRRMPDIFDNLGLADKCPWSSDEENEINYGTNGVPEMVPVELTANKPLDVDNSPEAEKLHPVNLLIVPFMFCHMLALYTLVSIKSSFFMDKACLNSLKYSKEICGNLSAHQSKLNTVQQVANDYSLYSMVIIAGPSVIISLFIGGWNNEHFRKYRVLISLFGLLFMEFGFLMSTMYMEWPLYYILIFSVPGGLFGGPPIAATYVYSFVSAKFSLKYRTLLYAGVKAARSLAVICSTFFSGQLFKYIGYEAVLGLCITAQFLCFLYILFFAKISKTFGKQEFKEMVRETFSLSTFLENFGAFTKKRANNERMELTLLTVSLTVLECVAVLPADVLYLFCNKMFAWDYAMYANVNTVAMISMTVVTIIASPICTKVLSVKDSAIGILGTLSLMSMYLIYGISKTEWVYYTGIGFGCFQDFAVFATISRLSKVVSADEVAQVFAIAATTESASPLIESLVATRLYNATIYIFPGFTLVFMTVLLLFPISIFIWSLRRERKYDDEDRKSLLPKITHNS